MSAKVLIIVGLDKTVEIDDIRELVRYLKDVIIYNEDNSYTEYVRKRHCLYLDYGRRHT